MNPINNESQICWDPKARDENKSQLVSIFFEAVILNQKDNDDDILVLILTDDTYFDTFTNTKHQDL